MSLIESRNVEEKIGEQFLGTDYLKMTGILDAYEHVIENLVTEAWPADKPVHDHAAYLLLKWQSDNNESLV